MASTIDDSITSLRFSGRDLPPRQRLREWNEFAGHPLLRRILAPPWMPQGRFGMTMTSHALCGGAGVCTIRMAITAGSARRSASLLADGNDDVILHIHAAGGRMVSQLGREAVLGPGGGLLTSNADATTILMPRPSRFASIAVPRKLMTAQVPGLEDAFLRPLPARAGLLRLLTGYLDLLDDGAALQAPGAPRLMATHIQDLCALALGATRDAAEIARGRGLSAARLRAVKADILRSLRDGGLSAAELARRQGVTPRYIHKLFAGEGTSLSHFLRGQRLALVHRMLTDPLQAGRTIGALAYEAGFGDLSTFNRDFRRQFGATPSDIRFGGAG